MDIKNNPFDMSFDEIGEQMVPVDGKVQLAMERKMLPSLIDYLYEGEEAEDAEEGMSGMDSAQLALDGIGLIPGVGIFADGLNALISTGRGDFVGAGLSLAAMVPGLGMAAGGGKLAKATAKIMKNPVMKKAVAAGTKGAAKVAQKAPKVAANIGKAGKTLTKAKTAMTKGADKMKDMHKAILSKDLKAVEKLTGKKIPDKFRAGAEEAMKMAGDKLKDVDFKEVMTDMDAQIKTAKSEHYEGEQSADGSTEEDAGTVTEGTRYDLLSRVLGEQYMADRWEDLKQTLHEQRLAALNN